MKQLKRILIDALLISTMLLSSGCGDGYKEFDLKQCEEVALQYLQDKYGEKFEVINSREAKKYIGSAGYVEVKVRKEEDEGENVYWLIVYPKEDKDENGDGYYDSYEVTSDDYMVELVNDVIKEKIDKTFIDAGFPEFFSTMGIEIRDDRKYKVGATSSFVETDAYNLSIKELFEKYEIVIGYSIYVLEEDYNENIRKQMEMIFEDIILNDIIYCEICTYDTENYNIRKMHVEQGGDYRVQEERKIEFFVED